MKACVLHAAKDLRIENAESGSLGPSDVRVAVAAGGICGSDLHYFHRGRVGDIELRQPMVLGHEVSGVVAETGSSVEHVNAGDLVALDPARTCGECRYCRTGRESLCRNVLYFGSAMRMPHVQGAFRQEIVVEGRQCVKFANAVEPEIAAFAEPLSVALHAVNRARNVSGGEVLVTGCGPIGCLAVLAARHAGADRIVATDVASRPLEIAARIGADETINALEDGNRLEALGSGGGCFDAAIEASGNPAGMRDCLRLLRPGGRLVQLGMIAPGKADLGLNRIVTGELEIVGSFRADREFRDAVRHLSDGSIDVSQVLSHRFPLSEAREAFEIAADRTKALKVQILFRE